MILRDWKQWGGASLLLFLLAAATDLLLPPPLQRAGALSPVVADRHGEWLHAFANEAGRWRFETDLEKIDPVFIERLIAIEDKRFYDHWGVDPIAVFRASLNSVRSGRIVSGASTISMQLARLLEPRPRNVFSKAIEVLRAVQIERRLSKDEILALYLTMAPYGGNLEGVRAASLFYFGKEPRYLTSAEQSLLIALPQAPEARRPDRREHAARSARAEIVEKLVAEGLLDASLGQEAIDASLPVSREVLPRFAYHTARRLSVQGAFTETTLDATLQLQAEALVKRHADLITDEATASLLIIDNETGEIRASVGAAGLDRPGGWIDLTRATRSPGSALKPFVYGLAFDAGKLSPQSIIDDMPRNFGDYRPENFDRSFRGEVRLREALQHSLNVPAVSVLNLIGAERFHTQLNAAGVSVKTNEVSGARAGLALALGGAGVTAHDLGALYAGLANGGAITGLIYTKDQASSQKHRLISDGAARRINAILADTPSLAGRAPARLTVGATRIAFKTGTSYGFRDAWAVGHNSNGRDPGVTIVAWVGRADGASRPGQTGRKAAAPLLFDAFDLAGEVLGAGAGVDIQENAGQDFLIARLDRQKKVSKPNIIFPGPGAELFIDDKERGIALSAQGGVGAYQWYADGAPINPVGERFIWSPARPGFYDLVVVDDEGSSSTTKVRVREAL